MIVLLTILNKAIICMCLWNKMSYLTIPGLYDDHMHQGENHPKPLLVWGKLQQDTWVNWLPISAYIWGHSVPAVKCKHVNTASVSSLLSLLSFQMGVNTILDNIPIYSALGFCKQNLCTYHQRGRELEESEACNLQISGKLNLSLNLKRSHW